MTRTLLQASDPDWFEAWKDGNWLEGVFGPFIWLLGEPAVVLLLVVPTALGLFIQTESIGPPAILIILFGGLILGGLPAEAAVAGYVIVVVAVLLGYRSVTGAGGQ